MTTEELRDRQLELFTAMIDGKQIQFQPPGCITTWQDIRITNSILWLLTENDIKHIRIKPEPRKVWVGWRGAEYVPVFAEDEESFRYMSNKYPAYNWQLVEEQV